VPMMTLLSFFDWSCLQRCGGSIHNISPPWCSKKCVTPDTREGAHTSWVFTLAPHAIRFDKWRELDVAVATDGCQAEERTLGSSSGRDIAFESQWGWRLSSKSHNRAGTTWQVLLGRLQKSRQLRRVLAAIRSLYMCVFNNVKDPFKSFAAFSKFSPD
jgi:hypothetical protein